MNNYSWDLSRERERDVIKHGTAHYSDNWTKEKQREYNHWYYKNVIKPQLKVGQKISNAITGSTDKATAQDFENASVAYNSEANAYASSSREKNATARQQESKAAKTSDWYDRESTKMDADYNRSTARMDAKTAVIYRQNANTYKKAAAAVREHYKNHTLAGLAEKIINAGKNVIDKLLGK